MVHLPKSGITIIVGPNSSGKSAFLRDIHTNTIHYEGQKHLYTWHRLELSRTGDKDDFVEWFSSRARTVPIGHLHHGKKALYESRENILGFDDAYASWQGNFERLARYLVTYMRAGERAGTPMQGPAREPSESPSHPLHFLWDDKAMELRFSRLVEKAFGFGICINRHTSRELYIHKGAPLPHNEPHPPTPDVLDRYNELPKLDQEGDGVRSFVAVLLGAIPEGKRLILIDEPEAFLHPPQARLIGRYLADETPAESQIIIATHSADVLQGILDGHNGREVKIIRLAGGGFGEDYCTTLEPERVQSLWTDPLMRYSRTLDGLFHKGIVICEADSDCRFYSAVLDAQLSQHVEHDLVFTHVGGKGRLGAALSDMRRFRIRSAIIGDLDVLNDKGRVRHLIEVAGGDFENIAADWNIIEQQVRSFGAGPIVRSLKSVVSPILSRVDSSTVTDRERDAIRDVLKTKNGWFQLKRGGIRALEGAAVVSAQRTLQYLQSIGIFLVPVGELERWFIHIHAQHGASYVTAVLEQGAHQNPTPELQDFIEALAAYFRVAAVVP